MSLNVDFNTKSNSRDSKGTHSFSGVWGKALCIPYSLKRNIHPPRFVYILNAYLEPEKGLTMKTTQKFITYTIVTLLLFAVTACKNETVPSAEPTTAQQEEITQPPANTQEIKTHNPSQIKQDFLEYIEANDEYADADRLTDIIMGSILVYGKSDIVVPALDNEFYLTYYAYVENDAIFLDSVFVIPNDAYGVTDDDNPFIYENPVEEKVRFDYDSQSVLFISLQTQGEDFYYGVPLSSLQEYMDSSSNLFMVYVEGNKIVSMYEMYRP